MANWPFPVVSFATDYKKRGLIIISIKKFAYRFLNYATAHAQAFPAIFVNFRNFPENFVYHCLAFHKLSLLTKFQLNISNRKWDMPSWMLFKKLVPHFPNFDVKSYRGNFRISKTVSDNVYGISSRNLKNDTLRKSVHK